MASRSQSWNLDALGNWSQVATDGIPQNRTHNRQNQIITVSGATAPMYDANGNMRTDEANRTYTYDAWDRLVSRTAGANVMTYAYDALDRRIRETSGPTRDLYYSSAWQVLEEHIAASASVQYVWSPVYVDALVLRDRDADNNGSLEERLYVQQDANFNVTAVVNAAGIVQERYAYDAYGSVKFLTPAFADQPSSNVAWVYLHQGGRLDVNSGLYHFRNRDHSSSLGRWMQTDPLGYADGMNLYGYLGSDPVGGIDPMGLIGPSSPFAILKAGGVALDAGEMLINCHNAVLLCQSSTAGRKPGDVWVGGTITYNSFNIFAFGRRKYTVLCKMDENCQVWSTCLDKNGNDVWVKRGT